MELETFFSVSEQTMQFLLSVVLGAGLGVVYDCFRVFRILFPPARKNGAVCVGDAAFMIISGAAVFLFAVVFCRSQVRLFSVIGALLGFVLYILTIGNFITGILKAIVSAICKILQKVYSAVFAPVVNYVKGICLKKFNKFVHSYENQKKTK